MKKIKKTTRNAVIISSSTDKSFIQLFFPVPPFISVWSELLENGFRYSILNQCWQCQENPNSFPIALDIIDK